MIDLHIHSNHSDGTFSVIEILKEAQRMNLDVISITDHDSIKAYKELENIDVKKYYSGKIIVGAEMKSVFKDIPVEILGYNIDLKKAKQRKYIDSLETLYLNIQREYLKHLKEVGKTIGLKFNEDIYINENKMQYASDIFQTEIKKYPENIDILKKNNIKLEPNFYRAAQCNPNTVFYIKETDRFPKVKELIDEIHKTGGLAFLAHPYIYPLENTLEFVEQIINETDLDGLECYYSYFTKEQTESLIKLCKTHNLYISGGTDFHGQNRLDTKLGIGTGDLNIEKEVINEWINKGR